MFQVRLECGFRGAKGGNIPKGKPYRNYSQKQGLLDYVNLSGWV